MKTALMEVACLLALCLFALQPVDAQSKRHEIKFGLGIGEDPHYNKITDDYKEAFGLDSYEDDFNADFNVSYFGEYFYHFSRMLAVGGTFGYSHLSGSWYSTIPIYEDGTRNDEYQSITINTKSLYLMPSVKTSSQLRTTSNSHLVMRVG